MQRTRAGTGAVAREVRRAPLRLALAGGGTGGHIQPGLHLLENLHALGVDAPFELDDLLWFATGRAVEARAFAGLARRTGAAPVEVAALTLEPAGGGAPSLSGLGLRALPAVRAARRALRRHGSQVVLGLGGFTSLPAVLAARSLRLPVALLEINAVRGRATRWLAPLADRVFHAWPATLPAGRGDRPRDRWTGPPLDSRFRARADGSAETAAARVTLGFDAERPLLVVLGGSQGAGGLNAFVGRCRETLARAGVQVLHQAGPGKLSPDLADGSGFRAVEYLDDVPTALLAAELVLCRGGASTLAEVCALERPAIVVPYPHHADRHQARNAAQLGAGVRVVEEGDLGDGAVLELCRLCSADGGADRLRMSRALRGRFPHERPGERILEELAQLAASAGRRRRGGLLPRNTTVE